MRNRKQDYRDSGFPERLHQACDGRKECPPAEKRGRQKWLREELAAHTGKTFSAEGVRKWFSGESRPLPGVMELLAVTLDVDPGWLALGKEIGLTAKAERATRHMGEGAATYVGGVIVMGGGAAAFTRSAKSDISAIIDGEEFAFKVLIPVTGPNTPPRLIIPKNIHAETTLLVVAHIKDLQYVIYRLPKTVALRPENLRGPYYELPCETQRSNLIVAGETLRPLRDLSDFT